MVSGNESYFIATASAIETPDPEEFFNYYLKLQVILGVEALGRTKVDKLGHVFLFDNKFEHESFAAMIRALSYLKVRDPESCLVIDEAELRAGTITNAAGKQYSVGYLTEESYQGLLAQEQRMIQQGPLYGRNISCAEHVAATFREEGAQPLAVTVLGGDHLRKPASGEMTLPEALAERGISTVSIFPKH